MPREYEYLVELPIDKVRVWFRLTNEDEDFDLEIAKLRVREVVSTYRSSGTRRIAERLADMANVNAVQVNGFLIYPDWP